MDFRCSTFTILELAGSVETFPVGGLNPPRLKQNRPGWGKISQECGQSFNRDGLALNSTFANFGSLPKW